MDARSLAEMISTQLFADGRFDNAPASGTGSAIAASTTANMPLSDTAFSGISIQAVGYEVDSKEPRVHIYASHGSVAALKALTTESDGIKITANKMASLKINPQLSAKSANRGHLFLRNSQIACGSSCAPSSEQYSGTFGALISDSSGKIYVLSNNHVLAACNHVPIGLPIMAPSTTDSHPTLPAPKEIGRHASIVELRSGEPSLVPKAVVDAAAALVLDPKAVSSWQGDPFDGYDTPTTFVKPSTGMRVKKWGRTTALTFGTLESELVMLPLPYKTKHFSAVVYFTDVWTIRADGLDPFALPGDSGSLVVTEDGMHALGLIFATTTSQTQSYGVMVTMDNVLNLLGSSLATKLSLLGNHQL